MGTKIYYELKCVFHTLTNLLEDDVLIGKEVFGVGNCSCKRQFDEENLKTKRRQLCNVKTMHSRSWGGKFIIFLQRKL